MEPVIRFMRERGIPEERIDFEGMSPEQRLYETDTIEKERLGNAATSEEQVAWARGTAEYFDRVSGGRRPFRVLDAGCGQGYHIYFMKESGLDACGLNISVVESELASHGVPDHETGIMMWQEEERSLVKVGSVLDMPYADEEMDGIACYGVLMMLPSTEKIMGGKISPVDVCSKALGEFHRVLKPGGSLHLVTFNKDAEKSPRTENYIFFGKDDYMVCDSNGAVLEQGGIGMGDILEYSGFVPTSIKGRGRIWKCEAYK